MAKRYLSVYTILIAGVVASHSIEKTRSGSFLVVSSCRPLSALSG